MKKILSLLLSMLMLALCACGSSNKIGTLDENGVREYIFGEKKATEKGVTLGTPEKTLNPEEVYKNLKYDPRMFYGNYRMSGGEEAEKKIFEDFGAYPGYVNKNNQAVSLLPYRFEAGPHSMAHSCTYIKGYNWCRITSTTEQGYMFYEEAAYEIDGNKIKITPLEEFNYDKDTQRISYKFSDTSFEYEFEFKGLSLVFSKDGKSVTLLSNTYGDNGEISISANGYRASDSETFENIDYISIHSDEDDNDLAVREPNYKNDNNCSIAKLSRNGLFTLTYDSENGPRTYQFVCFDCVNDGLILTDGEHTYYFTDSFGDRHSKKLGDTITAEQAEKLEKLSEEKLAKIEEKKEDLSNTLADAFATAGLKVSVDKANGEIAMDASVLFGGDSAEISSDGKSFLNKFIGVYSSVIFDKEYEGFISKVMIEGHAAPLAGSTYESGLPLSEERANNVKTYCLSSETGIDSAYMASLEKTLEAVGMSNTKPIIDANGNVNVEASRRVTFRFIINIE